jgi:transposase-like protein
LNPRLRTPQLPATHARAETGHRALTRDHTIDISRPPLAIHLHRATSCRTNEFIPFLDYPPELRRIVYTTNTIESINYQLRKITKTRGHFPSDEAAMKLLYLGLRNISNKRGGESGTGTQGWTMALNTLVILFPGRLPL